MRWARAFEINNEQARALSASYAKRVLCVHGAQRERERKQTATAGVVGREREERQERDERDIRERDARERDVLCVFEYFSGNNTPSKHTNSMRI